MRERLTRILKVKGDWAEVLNDCRSTVGKEPLEKEPSVSFKKRILISEHSPIRDILIKWFWEGIPHWVGVHWVRHKWEKFVRTQREDRAGSPRDQLTQAEPQNFTGEANIQHLIDTARKRLCYQASPETREYMEDLKTTIKYEVDPYIADVLVPNCVYRCGCPELEPCGFCETVEMTKDIQARYNAYNKAFYARKGK